MGTISQRELRNDNAGLLPGSHLRSLDALHLAAALALDVDAVLTYDQRLAQSCRDLGIDVLAPV
ncbi:hypothetical protein [Nocardioides acrostichi]|uniref:PIN domain-containing protein n=1 Tax=Nocardioides acrostichi TaxID=2784339 RepID=A0A930UZU9_9ACTN|nr:hypothetical protein [Nocardioides acrostichi]MBF4161147.1 hypothetical protein [Nocardioides acrostichi]